MGLSAWVGDKHFEIGSSPFFKSWFSTILTRLEQGRWGSEYPAIMNDFYTGRLSAAKATQALRELHAIRQRLRAFPPEDIVWDFENRAAQPPWGKKISPHITSLSNYFATSDGHDLVDVLEEAFEESIRAGKDVTIT
jgi:2,3-bisphosphoglycerate-dependent phosphoglycerate mutase